MSSWLCSFRDPLSYETLGLYASPVHLCGAGAGPGATEGHVWLPSEPGGSWQGGDQAKQNCWI